MLGLPETAGKHVFYHADLGNIALVTQIACVRPCAIFSHHLLHKTQCAINGDSFII